VAGRFLLDTSIFNKIVDLGVPPSKFEGVSLFVTHLQADELSATSSEIRRATLLRALVQVAPANLPTKSAAWDVSSWDEAGWGDDDGVYETLLVAIQAGDKTNRKMKALENQVRDALAAETAIKNQLILVTSDVVLADATLASGGQAISFEEFMTKISP